MPTVGEWSVQLHHNANGPFDATYEVNMPPSNVYAKVALTNYREYVTSAQTPPFDGQEAGVFIKFIKIKRSDGLITQVDINTIAAYDPEMTNVTVSVSGRNSVSDSILTLESWD